MECCCRRADSLPFQIPERQILRRLGYVRNVTDVDEAQRRMLAGIIHEGAALCRNNRGIYCAPLKISAIDADRVILASPIGDWHIDSPAVAAFLSRARGVWVGAVTLGGAITDAASQALQAGDGARAAVLDAVGSECADAVMDALQTMAASVLSRQGYTLDSRRFSPGYGGWTLDAQQHFFRLLQLEQLDLELTDSRMLIPEKSVTAIAPLY
ncbi:MAG: hypothetical protein J6S21_02755 [Victivallales bacterium]|nr:hypothetical protein [Victivallales bacterium]